MNDVIYINMQFGLNIAFLWVGAVVLFGGKIKRIWLGSLSYIVFLGMTLLGDLDIDFLGFVLSIMVIICYVLTTEFLVTNRRIKKFTVLCILLYLQELFVMILAKAIYLYRTEMEEQKWNTINSLWSLFIISGISFFYSRNRHFLNGPKFKGYIRKSMIPLLIFVTFEVVAMVVWYNISLEDSASVKHYLVGTVLSTASMISIGIIVVMVIYIKKSNEAMEHMLLMEQQLKRLQAGYYETLLEKEADTRKYRHDMSNHLICLMSLLEDSDIVGAKEYIERMSTNIQEIKKKGYDTGMMIFDVLLNYHVEQLEKKTIVKVKGMCKSTIDVSDIDMCIIFSNLVQNAVEALNRSGRADDILCIEIKEGKKFVKINITNSILQGTVLLDESGNLRTMKKDKQNHGFGISNVKETVDKNGGTIDYQIEEGQISCKVILPIRSI